MYENSEITSIKGLRCSNLIAIGQATHTRHDTENVIIDGIDVKVHGSKGKLALEGTRTELAISSIVKLENSVINAAEIAGATGLVLFGRESKAVAIDILAHRALAGISLSTHFLTTYTGNALVVLVVLDLAEVVSIADGETIVAIELKKGGSERIATAGIRTRVIEPVAGSGNTGRVSRAMVAGSVGPDELLDGVVEVQSDVLVGSVGIDSLSTSELDLLNQVFVADLGEAAALISVKIDVINIELAGEGTSGSSAGIALDEISKGAELEVKLDLVILESNQRQSQTRVAVEPELEGNIEAASGISSKIANLFAGSTSDIANHVIITITLASGDSKFSPDIHPVAILTVNELTTDLNLSLLNHGITNTISPFVAASSGNIGENTLEVHLLDQITITGDSSGDTLTEINLTVESLLNRLNSEVSVTTIDDLEESNLRVASQVNILGTISDKLHKTTTHFSKLEEDK